MIDDRDGKSPETGATDPTGAEEAPVVDAEVVEEEVPADDGSGTVEQDLASLIEEARSQRDEYLDLAQRTKADFDNFRKRMAAENAAARLRGRAEVIGGVIEAIDNLERVMAAEEIDPDAARDGEIPAELPVSVQGLIVAYRDLHSTLGRAGAEAFHPAGEPFDPNMHEALQAIPAEGVDSGVVVEVLQRGYRAEDQVIRPARVVVTQ